MKLLVTGGSGSIGLNFIRYVLATQPSVWIVNLDALTYAATRATLASFTDEPRYQFIEGDVREADLVDALVAEADAVVHFAAESHVDRSIEGPSAFLDANVFGPGVVFETCRRHGVERVLTFSTDEVYGSIESSALAAEGDAVLPNSPYAASKAAADLLARAYRITYGYGMLVTRTTNNFGPFQFPEKAVPLFITNLLDGRPIPLYGTGHNVRQWLYVLDNAEAQWVALTEGVPGTTYNVGSGTELTNREPTTALLERFGVGEELVKFVADRPGHDQRSAADTTRIEALGWSPSQRFGDALDATIDWYRANEAWWRPLKDAGASRRRGQLS